MPPISLQRNDVPTALARMKWKSNALLWYSLALGKPSPLFTASSLSPEAPGQSLTTLRRTTVQFFPRKYVCRQQQGCDMCGAIRCVGEWPQIATINPGYWSDNTIQLKRRLVVPHDTTFDEPNPIWVNTFVEWVSPSRPRQQLLAGASYRSTSPVTQTNNSIGPKPWDQLGPRGMVS